MTLDLDELERLEREATAGPWRVNTFHPNSVLSESRRCLAKCISFASPGGEEDAALIAALRNAAPALIARARRADELEAVLPALIDLLKTRIADMEARHDNPNSEDYDSGALYEDIREMQEVLANIEPVRELEAVKDSLTTANPPENPDSSDIVQRLLNACNGHPDARILWPYWLFHDAAARIRDLEAENASLLDLVERHERARFP
jgi:hypothetical protein